MVSAIRNAVATYPDAPAILGRLDGVSKTANGWQARCPAHDDRTASLSVSLGDDGRTLVNCHAGCSYGSVVQAVGLTSKDLGPISKAGEHRSGKPTGTVDTAYDYRDEAGKLLYQVVRYRDPKDFRPRVPKADGGWEYSLGKVRRVLYRLPNVLAADQSALVYVVEGEKDADRLWAAGAIATCSAGGAEGWRSEYADSLRGRSVVVVPDNDAPGRRYATKVAASLQGKAGSIKVVELTGLPDKGDVSDWLDAGGTLAALDELATNAPDWTPAAPVAVLSDGSDLGTPSGRTDIANARRLAKLHGNDLRWCEPWGKWVAWDGRRWAVDAERRVGELAKNVSDDIWKHVGTLSPALDHATQRELVRFAQATASAKGVASMLELTKGEPGIPILPDKFDADPWLLNCANGTIDLRTAILRPHDRSNLITKHCPTEYAPGAEGECPLWEQTVDSIFGRNRELCGFVQRLLGAAIVGKVVEHILPIFWGDGSNGKGLLLETVMDVLGGDIACKIGSDVLLAAKNNRHPTELADLHGKRLVVASETDDGRRLREGLLKELTGGDTIKARRMREDFWQFSPSHSLVLLTNHRPVVRGTDHGIWRRLCLVPFVQSFWDADRGESGAPELKADKHLREKLRAEHPGILRWLVDGCRRWQVDGLREPVEVRDATAEYRASQDTLGAFIGECCVEHNACTARAGEVYAAYVDWCKASGEHAIKQRQFGVAISQRGIERYKRDGVWYRGLGLATERTEQTERTF